MSYKSQLLVRDDRKLELRINFFRRYFEQTEVFLVNATWTPEATHQEIGKILFPKYQSVLPKKK
jgi:hypothetical protein